MCHTLVTTSPFNCRWIQKGSEGGIDGFKYAVCLRLHDAERVVNEAQCMYCPLWEPSPVRSSDGKP
jgi:hypothetical protein